jgi:hypothetical protein
VLNATITLNFKTDSIARVTRRGALRYRASW